MTYVVNPTGFHDLWNMISDDPEENLLTPEMINILPPAVECSVRRISEVEKSQKRPIATYVLISESDPIRIINVSEDTVRKHEIGKNPAAWSYTNHNVPIPETPGRGPVYTISDIKLLEAGIFNIIDNSYNLDKEVPNHAGIYAQIVKDIYNHDLQLGDMVYIPVYDHYSGDHDDIYYFVLVFNGQNLVRPKEMDDYACIPPKETY